MGDSAPINASARSGGVLPFQKPRWAFFKGLLTGAAVEIPLLVEALRVLAWLGVGDRDADLMQVFRLTAVFAGVAALLTAGGVGRLAAYALVDGAPAVTDPGRRRRRAVLRAARAHAVASAGLVVIAAIPLGHLPERPTGWLAFAAAGLVAGAVAGTLIGLVCTAQTALVPLTEVWALARRPRVALRSLIDAEDLARLGSALRTRTTNLFEGIFEPAPLPPQAAEAAAAATAAAADAASDAAAAGSDDAARAPAAATPAEVADAARADTAAGPPARPRADA